jgi:uncharacterized membrane protein YhaH (DUF805 family)
MTPLGLFTRFDGRIGRAAWWRGFLALASAAFLTSLAIDPGVWTARPPRPPHPGLALCFLILVLPMTAVSMKRFRDRERPGWYGIVLGLIGAGLILGEQLGFMVTPERAGPLERAAFWLAAGLLLLGFVDNGFLRGTPGPNRHGPDRLAG